MDGDMHIKQNIFYSKLADVPPETFQYIAYASEYFQICKINQYYFLKYVVALNLNLCFYKLGVL